MIDVIVPARLGVSYRWLLASSWATNLGDGIAMAAGPLLVASLTDDAFLVALAALLRWAPQLVFGLYAGVLSDRLNRRRIVIAADLTRAGVLALLVVTTVTGQLSAVLALVALGLLATTEVFADNTATTLTPMLTRRDDLAAANSRLQAGFITLNHLVGPPIGAALFAAGSAWPFVTEAVLVIAGALLVSRVVLPGRDGGSPHLGGSALRDVAAGLRWVTNHPPVRTLILTILVFDITFGAAWSVMVLYTQQRLGLGAVGFGLLSTVSAAGGLLGTALYGWLTRRVSLGNVMRVGLIIETLTHLVFAVTTSPWTASLVFFVFGAHSTIWGTTSLTVRQRAVPIDLQGRVTSINTICVYGGLVTGSVAGGTLATQAGVTAPFWFAFIGSALFVLGLWRKLSRIDDPPERPAARARECVGAGV